MPHCARYMGVAQEADSDSVALDKLVDGLRQLSADLAVPSPRDYGIDEKTWNSSLVTMAEQALASGSPANNPRVPSADEIIGLYGKVYG